jgi:hypothetical protein
MAGYTFLPWYRTGLVNKLRSDGAIKVDLEYKVDGSIQSVSKNIRLAGPGEVVGINPTAIIRTLPAEGALDFEANCLASIEFYEEDFPWRYSPLSNPDNDQLEPWLVLWVLREEEFTFQQDTVPLPSIHITSGPGIIADETWAWAHVQVNQQIESQATIRSTIEENPDIAFSRLLCPRRLAPGTKYHAFLIPAFEAGRKSGIGEPFSTTDITANAWDAEQKVFPYYHHWSFRTAVDGDFETLLRRLTPAIPQKADLWMDIGDLFDVLGFIPLSNTDIVSAPTLFQVPDYQLSGLNPGIKPRLKTKLETEEDQPSENTTETSNTVTGHSNNESDPLLSWPVYGRIYDPETPLDPEGAKWMDTLNLDPRYRAIARLGEELVRQNQEEWMDQAWDQIGDYPAFRTDRRHIRFATEIEKKLLLKHFDQRSEASKLTLTQAIHDKIALDGKTMRRKIIDSNLSRGGVEPVFRKMLIRHKRYFPTPDGVDANFDNVRARLNSKHKKKKISAAREKPNLYDEAFYVFRPNADLDNFYLNLTEKDSTYINKLTNWKPTASTQREALDGSDVFSAAFNPEENAAAKIQARYPGTDLRPFTFHPLLEQAVFPYLQAMASYLLVPQFNQIKPNTVLLMEVNQAFIEALMVGMNEELGREMIWREYPADPTATFFQQFWDYGDYIAANGDTSPPADITPISNWSRESSLGDHLPSGTPKPTTVLLIRSDLLRKFPNAIIYAQPAIQSEGERIIDDNQSPIYPITRTWIEPDIVVLGFQFSPNEFKSDDGYFFVFVERPGDARFGLDVWEGEGTPPPITSWNGLYWEHLTDERDLITIEKIDHLEPESVTINGVTWGQNSAHMASILLQQPVMLGIHSSDLLP